METTTKTKDKTFDLSEDQVKAHEAINEWLTKYHNSRDENIFFALTGAAGTGKTTLMNQVLKDLKSPYSAHKVCICAPTHKAKKVLKQKTGWNNSETLQALLGLKLDVNLEDFDVNNPMFSSIGDRKIRDYNLVVIDESSMINSELYSTINECARTTGTKILFVGDSKQLNPVKEYAISPALLTPIHKYNLTQIVRQADTNPLILLLDIVREDIENGTSKHIRYMQENPSQFNDKGEGYLITDREGFAAELTKEFGSEAFKEDKNYCRYIAWTNEAISKTNKWIRNSILACNETLIVGELLLSYRTLLYDDDLLLVNSDDYIIHKIEDGSGNNYGINTWNVVVECIDNERRTTIEVIKPDKENYDRFIEVFNEHLDTAKERRGKAWPRFFNFRDSFVLLETLTQTVYGKNSLVTKKDIDYGYGVTIHKSQGSTYNTVFVNGKDINRNSNDAEKLKLWYVALSRASNKVIINL